MRSVLVLCVCLLTACSTPAVKCERHLTPINVPERSIADALALAGKANDASSPIGTAAQPHGAPPRNAAGQSDLNGRAVLRPRTGGEGSP
jgi:hypothetical protein